MLRFKVFALMLLVLVPSAANAEWREAVSKNFIVYSEGSEETLRDAATRLEKYDFLLRFASKVTKPNRSPKLKIYLMRDFEEVQGTLGYPATGVAGYYTASPRGAIAIGSRSGIAGAAARGTRIGGSTYGACDAQAVLLHEYAHHFMFQHFPAAYPAWYSEGFAEYYGTTKFLPNDVIEVGHPAGHRYLSFEANEWLPLSKMLTAKNYSDIGSDNLHLLYAQGWLLVHYLAINKERSGQLSKYLNALNAGVDYRTAMDQAFGPGAKELDEELRGYSGRGRLMAVRLPFKPIDVGTITVRQLSPAEQALVRAEIALGRGVLVTEAPGLAKEVRSIASRFPNDPYALSILAEAERAAGNRDAANATIERWLAMQPGAPRALMHKAAMQIDALEQARSTDEVAWENARKPLLEAHKRAPRDPMILEAYYDSFLAEGVLPPAGAQNALVRAFELVPQDDDLRYKLAYDFEQRQMIEDAIMIIKPAAFSLSEDENPAKKAKREKQEAKYREVGEVKRETAREMLARLEAKLAGSRGTAAASK